MKRFLLALILWTTTGRADEPFRLVKDLVAGPEGLPGVEASARIKNRVVFRTWNQIFVTDGTSSGTFPLATLIVDRNSRGEVPDFVPAGDRLYFRAYNPLNLPAGPGLFRTDGNGVEFVASDVERIFLGRGADLLLERTIVGGTRLSLFSDSSGEEVPIRDVPGNEWLRGTTPCGERLILLISFGWDAASDMVAFSSDGTREGTQELLRFPANHSFQTQPFREGLYALMGGEGGERLIFTTGTITGTREIPLPESARYARLGKVVEGSLFLRSRTPGTSDQGYSLWSLDAEGHFRSLSGSVWGTPGGGTAAAGEVNGRFLYRAGVNDLIFGGEPFGSDGRVSALLADLDPRPWAYCPSAGWPDLCVGASLPYSFVPAGRETYFLARADRPLPNYYTIFKTDGTTAGTKLLTSPSTFRFVQGMTRTNDAIIFFADDGIHGMEPWAIDIPSDGKRFRPLTPCAVPIQPPALKAGESRVIPIEGRCGVPDRSRAVSLRVSGMSLGRSPGRVQAFASGAVAPSMPLALPRRPSSVEVYSNLGPDGITILNDGSESVLLTLHVVGSYDESSGH